MQNNLHLNSFISLAKLRLREPVKNARDAVKKFETNLTSNELKKTVEICCVGITEIGEIARDDLAAAQNLGFLQLIAELVHRVIDIARSSTNIKKLGKDSVIEAIDKFIELINNVLSNIGSNDVTHLWIENGDLEDLSVAFPVSSCVFRKKLTTQEIQAHSKLFTIKGDLHRYKSNITKVGNYNDAMKSYWKAFSFDPGHGIIFNQLGVISSACDSTDRLSTFFFRALYAQTPFQNAKEFLMTKLGAITDKMIQSDFSKYSEIFKNPSVSDTNGIFASSIKNSGPQEYYFPWFKKSSSLPNWKLKLTKLSPSIVCKIHVDNFFHMINLLCTKQSHQTLFPTCERFLVLTQFLLDSELLSSKQLLQITTIFLLALKSRDEKKTIVDENFENVSRTFLFFVGLLLSKVYDFMEIINDSKFENAKVNTILPSLVVIECYWESVGHLFPSMIYLSPSFTFDFSVIRKKISKLGSFLKDYLTNLKVEIKRTKLDDISDNTFMPPEIILCCLGSRFSADCNPLQLSSSSSSSEKNTVLFQSFLIRVSIVQELLFKMVNKGLFGLTSSFEYSQGKNDLSTFEIFALAYNKGSDVYAVYPEYIALDTNTIIDEYERLMAVTQYGMKFIIPTVVWSELQSISRDKRKDETIRLSAKNAAELISKTIENRSNDFQIYNFYGERKFDLEFSGRDLQGLNNKTGREKARDNNDDFIISICRKIEDILGSSSTKKGFYDSKIHVRNVVLLTEDRILRIKAHSETILTCGFSDFFTWFNNNCISSIS
uniref:PIN domain-containing protein n=1 Tax=Panagrolaimus davidi TaxID=227884 RepID=A0A914QE06_9BILA